MKAKQKDLGTLRWLSTQELPRTFGTSKIFKIKYFAKSVREKLELLNETENEVAKKIDPNWNPYEGFPRGEFYAQNINEFEKQMKPVYEEEIEVDDFPPFKLDDWKSLPLNGDRLDKLTELGIIVEE